MALVTIRIPEHLQEARNTLFNRRRSAWVDCGPETVWRGTLGELACFELERDAQVSVCIDDGTEMATVSGWVKTGCNYSLEFVGYKGLFRLPEYKILQI